MTGGRDKLIKLWDIASGQMLRNFVRLGVVPSLRPRNLTPLQAGHDNWIRALVFHPSGKYLLSASDDKTIRIWELATGRCMRTIDANLKFVTTMQWGRKRIGGAQPEGDASKTNGVNGDKASDEPEKLVNVLATGCTDHSIKIWLP